ncbi:MAG: glutathione S-transferase family protein [Pseudomonadales bacterium]|nr:glutathione S-transferase family protein [Pseudomonadales bacterium]
MGLLVKGQWQDQWYKNIDGEYKREDAGFRNWITADGSAGPTGQAGFKAESGRYHLFVSLACPWAHRTLIFRQIKDLTAHIGVTVVAAPMLENGWEFQPLADDINSDENPISGLSYLHQVYTQAKADYTGRVTVPVLWDKKTQTIVNNESSEIIRMFNTSFNEVTGNQQDYYPSELRENIDELNTLIYHTVNNGVYKAGFATSQQAYDNAFEQLFSTLDQLDDRLAKQRYLTGATITEADWRLFTTLIRFDAVYVGHFKCNRQRIEDYRHLSAYLRDLYQQPGIADTVHFGHIKQHYYFSHTMINPSQIIPKGPQIDYLRPHYRQQMFNHKSAAQQPA